MAILIRYGICRSDNYFVLAHDEASGRTAAIDAPDAGPITAEIATAGWTLTDIILTHKHGDHIAGVAALKERFGCRVHAGAATARFVPETTDIIADGDAFALGGMSFDAFATPGHCDDHMSFVLREARTAFLGDALFAMGCGRVLEGAPETLYRSLMRIAALPDEMAFHCGHEYTLANARFALTVEPDNPAIIARANEVEVLRKAGAMTLPSTIGLEKKTNVFLRAGSAERFAALRDAKNRF